MSCLFGCKLCAVQFVGQSTLLIPKSAVVMPNLLRIRSFAKKTSLEAKQRQTEIDQLFTKAEFLSMRKNRPPGWEEFGGDGEDFQQLNAEEMKAVIPKFANCKELDKAPAILKKLLSMEYAPRKRQVRYRLEETVRRYQYHADDTSSMEARIAALTVNVRNLKEHVKTNRLDGRARHILNTQYQRRNRHLKKLKDWNADQHRIMCEELSLVPVKRDEPGTWKTRNSYLRKLAIERYWELKREKLVALAARLKDQVKDFEVEKANALKEMALEREKLGITDGDVENVLNPETIEPGKDGMRHPPLKVRAP